MKQFLYIVIILWGGLFISCKDDLHISGKPAEKEVFINLDLPGDISNSEIQTLHVVAFLYDGTDYIYAYDATPGNINYGENNATFSVMLKAYEQPQRFFIIANAADEIAQTVLYNLTISELHETLVVRKNMPWTGFIPMCSLTDPVSLSALTSNLGSFCLVRMLSRIDLRTASAVTNFQLTKAFVFNSKDCGSISYMDEFWDSNDKRVTAASVPANAVTTKVPEIYYEAIGNSISGTIYTFESEAPAGWDTATAVVIGGYFDCENNQTKETYYRIDIPEFISGTAQENTLGGILRNHLYEISITGVSKEGEETPEEAFDKGVLIEADVKSWNLVRNRVLFEGQYSFSISTSLIHFGNRYYGEELITVSTNHPGGITASIVEANSWITISDFTNGNQSGTMRIIAAQENTTGATRLGNIHFIVGDATDEPARLEYTLTVSQSGAGWVQWNNHQLYYTSGREYNPENGNAPEITALSNWVATLNDPKGIIASNQINSGSLGKTESSFSLKNMDDSQLYHVAEVTFSDPDGIYPDVVYPVINIEGPANNPDHVSNCIITTGTSAKILSAYRKACAIWRYGDGVSGELDDLSSAASFSARVVWQDVRNLIQDTNISVSDDGNEINITNIGGISGNAVVALQANGIIIWSWHVWKLSTQPAVVNGWMDRNLGGETGLLYQWGRKDPFKPSDVNRNSADVPIPLFYNLWDGNGTIVQSSTYNPSSFSIPLQNKEKTSAINNLKNSISNPFIFYTGISSLDNPTGTDWYTADGGSLLYDSEGYYYYYYQNNNLWEGKAGDKMPFDPCPLGYRVPSYRMFNGKSPWENIEEDGNISWPTTPYSNFGGITSEPYGGFYPFAGSISLDGWLSPVKSNGSYWSATAVSEKNITRENMTVNIMYMAYNTVWRGIFPTLQRERSSGYSVRCVKAY